MARGVELDLIFDLYIIPAGGKRTGAGRPSMAPPGGNTTGS
jgi:hypothetical protein